MFEIVGLCSSVMDFMSEKCQARMTQCATRTVLGRETSSYFVFILFILQSLWFSVGVVRHGPRYMLMLVIKSAKLPCKYDIIQSFINVRGSHYSRSP